MDSENPRGFGLMGLFGAKKRGQKGFWARGSRGVLDSWSSVRCRKLTGIRARRRITVRRSKYRGKLDSLCSEVRGKLGTECITVRSRNFVGSWTVCARYPGAGSRAQVRVTWVEATTLSRMSRQSGDTLNGEDSSRVFRIAVRDRGRGS